MTAHRFSWSYSREDAKTAEYASLMKNTHSTDITTCIKRCSPWISLVYHTMPFLSLCITEGLTCQPAGGCFGRRSSADLLIIVRRAIAVDRRVHTGFSSKRAYAHMHARAQCKVMTSNTRVAGAGTITQSGAGRNHLGAIAILQVRIALSCIQNKVLLLAFHHFLGCYDLLQLCT